MRQWYIPGLLGLLGLVVGCGGPLVNASGRLTYKGKPIPSTIVTFWPEEEGKRQSAGVTDDDGKFTLAYSRTEPGVLRGKHTVTLTYYVSGDEEMGKIPPKASKEQKAVIGKYFGKDSPLKYEVKSNGQTIDIDLQ